MPIPNFFAPGFAVTINGQKLQADVSKNIVDVRVADNVWVNGKPVVFDSFSLTLANPYPDMCWTHDPKAAELFREGTIVQVEMGYVDDMHLMIEGTITSFSPTFPASGTPTVTIQGKSRADLLARQRSKRTFENVTDRDIVATIASDNHLALEADATSITYASVSQGDLTDLDFIRDRAKRLSFEVSVKGKTLTFRQPRYTKLYTLVWGHPKQAYDRAGRVMPLNDFNPTLNLNDQVSRVIVRSQDRLTGELIEGLAENEAVERKIGGQLTGPSVAEEALGRGFELVIVDQPVGSQQEAEQRARAHYNEHAFQFLTGNGSTIGLPELRAGQLVEIKGLGYRFSGEYYVTQTVHAIGNAGYRTSFQVRRNAVP